MQLSEFVSQSWLLTPNFGQCSPWEEAMTVQDWVPATYMGNLVPASAPTHFSLGWHLRREDRPGSILCMCLSLSLSVLHFK